MKFTKKLFGMAAVAMVAGIVSSCNNELNEPGYGLNGGKVRLVKSPEMTAWSGSEYLNVPQIATRGTDMNANMYSDTWQCERATIFPSLTEADIEEIKRLLSKGEPTTNNIIIPWPNYFVEQIYMSDQVYDALNRNGGDSGEDVSSHNQMNQLSAWNGHDYEHINNFNNGANTSTPGADKAGHVHTGTTLMTDMPNSDIDPNGQFRYHNSWDSKFYNNYIIVEYNGDWYVGFDFEAFKDGIANDNEEESVRRDWNFTDWIVRISPAYHNGYRGPRYADPYDPNEEPGVTDPSDPSDPTDPEDPDNPEDPSIPTDPENPGNTPSLGHKPHMQEVEVNFEIVDSHAQYQIADLVTKLSIHVRHATDVEIKIPVHTSYVIESDDLYIFNEHYINGAYGGSLQDMLGDNIHHSVSYQIGENTVVLNVEFVDDETGSYIKVYTEGINDNVIDYCYNYNKDGINFEIWNYYQTEIVTEDGEIVENPELNREKLLECLNGSTIHFTHNPDYYINAFGWDYVNGTNGSEHLGVVNPDDCYVRPLDSRYGTPNRTTHLNGTPFNDIYTLEGVTADGAHGGR